MTSIAPRPDVAPSRSRSCRAEPPTLFVPVVQTSELAPQDRRLQRVQPRGRSDDAVLVARALAVRAQQLDAFGELGHGRHDGATVAPGSEVLGRVEAEAADHAERADAPSAVAGAMCLAGILDHVDPGLAREREDRIEIDGGAEQVHRDYAAYAGVEVGGDDLGGDQMRVGVDVDQSRSRADGADRLRRGDERVGRHDHLVAGADLQRAQRQYQRLGARGDADREVGLAVGRELLLEGLDGLAEREGAPLGDGAHGAQQLLEQLGVGEVEPCERNGVAALARGRW